jgi:8-oxo-dGTP pyrophosphatase MutT (NUDIX family)
MKINIKTCAVVEQGGRVLLIKEWSNKRNGYFWNLIKGTFDKEENESLTDCAIREAQEEAGLEIEIDDLISCYCYSDKVVGLQFNFLAHPKDGSKIKLIDKSEQEERDEDIIELKWFTKKDLFVIKPEEFISRRISNVLRDWKNNKSYAFDDLRTIE